MKDEIQGYIDDLHGFFRDYRGVEKPNACNPEGIPYHAFEEGYHWQIGEHSTTSECVTLLCRALAEAGYLDYAKQIADYIIEKLDYDNISTIHWLVNLVDNGVEMETDVCGNYDDSIFSFVNSKCLIPAGFPYFGERIIPEIDFRYYGVRGVFSLDAIFPYRDFWIEKRSGVEYSVKDYRKIFYNLIAESGERLLFEDLAIIQSECVGTEVELEDSSINEDLQVYYGYRNGKILNKDELYRTYPLNTPCIVPFWRIVLEDLSPLITEGGSYINSEQGEFQISTATDGILWAIPAFRILSQKTGDSKYSDYADELLQEMLDNSNVVTDGISLFSASDRAASLNSVFIYEEDPARQAELNQENDIDADFVRFDYKAGNGVVKFGVGESFNWLTGQLICDVKGNASGALRNVVLSDGETDYISAFIDDFNHKQTLVFTRGNFGAINNTFLDHNRIPYLSPYNVNFGTFGTTSFKRGVSSISLIDSHTPVGDSEGLNYPFVYKFNYACTSDRTIKYDSYGDPIGWNYNTGGCIFGTGHIEGVETAQGSVLTLIMAANPKRSNLRYKVIGADNKSHEGKFLLEVTEFWKEFNLPLDSTYFTNGEILHPIKNIELIMQDDDYDYKG